jgi:hypothetical protein
MLISNGDNIDSVWQYWKANVMSTLTNNVPIVCIKNTKFPPWVDADVIHASNLKNSLFRKYKRTNKGSVFMKYKDACKNVKNLVRQKYLKYLNNMACNVKSNPKRFWSMVKHKDKNKRIPDKMFKGDQIFMGSLETAKAFNAYFQSVFVDIDNIPMPPLETFNDIPITSIRIHVSNVRLYLEQQKNDKAIGIDNIPNIILSKCANILAPSLTLIINYSLEKSVVPTEWKIARVCPVYKKGDKCDITNYRPISLLPVISKIAESCILDILYPRIKPFLYKLQHGFMKNRSAVLQLLDVYDKINRYMDNGIQCDIAFLDFAKAFDTVHHKLLLYKLSKYGIKGELLKWFESYVSNRKQFVVIDGIESTICSVTSGVPQGSVLGPFLFLIFINDLPLCIERATMALFADDSKLFMPIITQNDHEIFNDQIKKCHTWSSMWKMKFNVSKSYIMSMTNRQHVSVFDYVLGNTILEHVNVLRDLGVLVTSNLSWSDHIINIKAKAMRNLGFIKRTLGYKSPLQARKLLYLSLVRSHLLYCSQIWSPLMRRDVLSMESVQRSASKYLTNYQDISYVERLKILGLIPLSYLRDLHTLLLFFNILHNRLDIDTDRYFISKNAQPPALLRPYRRHLFRTEKGRQFFTNRVLLLWDAIPVHIKLILPTNDKKSGILPFKKALLKWYSNKLSHDFNIYNICTWFTKCTCVNCRS